jgi:hypothetical protein
MILYKISADGLRYQQHKLWNELTATILVSFVHFIDLYLKR